MIVAPGPWLQIGALHSIGPPCQSICWIRPWIS